MANEIKLECYSIRIRKVKSKEALLLNKIKTDKLGTSEDIFDFAIDFFTQETKKFHTIKESLKAFEIKQSHPNQSSRVIAGIIESGDYGLSSTIRDTKTGSELFKRKETDTEQMPFYFLIYLPKDKALGFLLIQRTGIYGINHIFRQVFNSHFKLKYSDLMLEMAPVVSKSLADQFLAKGVIKEILIRNYKSAADITDKLGLKNLENDVLEVKIIITSKQKKFFNYNSRVQKFIQNPNNKLFDLHKLGAIGFDSSSQYSIKVKHGNNYRTIDLTDTAKIAPYYDIDADVKKIAGHPIFESIDLVANQLISELEEEIYN